MNPPSSKLDWQVIVRVITIAIVFMLATLRNVHMLLNIIIVIIITIVFVIVIMNVTMPMVFTTTDAITLDYQYSEGCVLYI